MATLKRRLYRKNDTGTYDTVHLETDASLVYMSNGNTVENQLTSHVHDDRYYTEGEVNSLVNGKANAYHTHDASQVVSGILPQHLGGTGYNSLDQLKNALGISGDYGLHKVFSQTQNIVTSVTNNTIISNSFTIPLTHFLYASQVYCIVTLQNIVARVVNANGGDITIKASSNEFSYTLSTIYVNSNFIGTISKIICSLPFFFVSYNSNISCVNNFFYFTRDFFIGESDNYGTAVLKVNYYSNRSDLPGSFNINVECGVTTGTLTVSSGSITCEVFIL